MPTILTTDLYEGDQGAQCRCPHPSHPAMCENPQEEECPTCGVRLCTECLEGHHDRRHVPKIVEGAPL